MLAVTEGGEDGVGVDSDDTCEDPDTRHIKKFIALAQTPTAHAAERHRDALAQSCCAQARAASSTP